MCVQAIVGDACYAPISTIDAITASSSPLSAGKVLQYYVQCNNESIVNNPINNLLNNSYYEALQINNTLNEYYADINSYLSLEGFSTACAFDMASSVSCHTLFIYLY